MSLWIFLWKIMLFFVVFVQVWCFLCQNITFHLHIMHVLSFFIPFLFFLSFLLYFFLFLFIFSSLITRLNFACLLLPSFAYSCVCVCGSVVQGSWPCRQVNSDSPIGPKYQMPISRARSAVFVRGPKTQKCSRWNERSVVLQVNNLQAEELVCSSSS